MRATQGSVGRALAILAPLAAIGLEIGERYRRYRAERRREEQEDERRREQEDDLTSARCDAYCDVAMYVQGLEPRGRLRRDMQDDPELRDQLDALRQVAERGRWSILGFTADEQAAWTAASIRFPEHARILAGRLRPGDMQRPINAAQSDRLAADGIRFAPGSTLAQVAAHDLTKPEDILLLVGMDDRGAT